MSYPVLFLTKFYNFSIFIPQINVNKSKWISQNLQSFPDFFFENLQNQFLSTSFIHVLFKSD